MKSKNNFPDMVRQRVFKYEKWYIIELEFDILFLLL